MVVIAYLVCALIWSTTWFAIRICIAPGGYPVLPAAAMRFTIAAILLAAVLAAGFGRPGPRTRRQLAWLVAAGLLNALCYGLVYLAEESLPGGLVAVLFGTYPLFAGLGAAATGTERVRPIDLAGAVISLVGMTLVFGDRLAASWDQASGVALVLGSVVASVGYSIIVKREAGGVNPLASSAVFLAVGAAGLWVASAAAGPVRVPWPPPPAPTAALLYLAVLGTVLAFGCYFYLLKRVSLMTVSTLVLIEPVLALLVDAAWERQVRLVPRSYAGVALTFAGVATALTWKWREGRRERLREAT